MRKSISNLSGYCNLIIGLIAHWALVFVTVVKGDGNSGFGDTGLSTFVDQLLQIAGTHLSRHTGIYIASSNIYKNYGYISWVLYHNTIKHYAHTVIQQ